MIARTCDAWPQCADGYWKFGNRTARGDTQASHALQHKLGWNHFFMVAVISHRCCKFRVSNRVSCALSPISHKLRRGLLLLSGRTQLGWWIICGNHRFFVCMMFARSFPAVTMMTVVVLHLLEWLGFWLGCISCRTEKKTAKKRNLCIQLT